MGGWEANVCGPPDGGMAAGAAPTDPPRPARYTAEQQARLGVDEFGAVADTNANTAAAAEGTNTDTTAEEGRRRAVGPAWTYTDSVEPPAGQVDLGTYVANVYGRCFFFSFLFSFESPHARRCWRARG